MLKLNKLYKLIINVIMLFIIKLTILYNLIIKILRFHNYAKG